MTISTLSKLVHTKIKTNYYFWVFFLISTFVFFLWWAAFFPGIMSPDSIDQWKQASSLQLGDWHPYLHTLYIYCLRIIYDSPATISIFQIVFTSILFSYIFSYFIKLGLGKKLIYFFFLVFISSIPIGLYTITLWKDVPFSLCLIGFTFLICKFLIEKKVSYADCIILILFSIGATFFRHNGIINLFIFPVLIWLSIRKISLPKTWILISTYLSFFLIGSFLLPSLLHVEKKPSWLTQIIFYQESISALQKFPFWSDVPRINEKTKQLLNQLAPEAVLLKLYDPRYSDFVTFSEKINRDVMTEQFSQELRKEFLSYTLPMNLNFFIGDRVVTFITSTMAYGNTAELAVYSNTLGLKTTPLSSTIARWMNQLAAFSLKPSVWRFIIWNSFISILVLAMIFIDSAYKKRGPALLFSSVILIHIGSLAVGITAGDWRYYYFAYLSIFISIPLWLIKNQPANNSKP